MKKIYLTLVIFVIAFSGCSRKFEYIPKQEMISSLDFTKYSEKGFLVTPSDYGSNYEALGIFTFTVE
jgi:PBP1b-binding outer membrane lipoprotein LpoB